MILVIAWQTFREQLRARALQVAVLFAGVVLYMSLLLGLLAAEQELRVLFDFGLSLIELMGSAIAVYGASTAVLHEMETKTIYLILARPVPRSSYLLGRTAGLLLTAAAGILMMAAAHLSVLLLKGWAWQWGYLLALLGLFLKLSICTALATFLALLSTSTLSALTMTSIAWTLGHFTQELDFLVHRTDHRLAAAPMKALLALLPHLQLFNFRDRPDIPPAQGFIEPVLPALAYAAVYGSACLLAAHALLRRREF